nr:unnamed protein product [Spirometra erinaceieuropaei]
MSPLPTRTDRSRRTPSDPMLSQLGNVYLFSHSRSCRRPGAERHPRHSLFPATTTIRLALTPASPPPPPPQLPGLHALSPTTGIRLMSRHLLPSPPALPPPAMRTRFISIPIATEYSARTSAWSITGKSIARRLANQCLAHQTTLIIPASTALTAPVHSLITGAYLAICAFTKTCDR